ncbi:EAL domain-containing protein [Gluconacetobacter azotocaptans]|uniref:EAL domain-containing protein n=2 Tax=Gluconacetobacter azotocaptans TaxID=142834 RepID=A0A7W4JVP6_9PROT|nr:EAL domain-containing protein [Gluconacetobacter azotocaptans]MBM9400987.1 EAL domain-containing protein [Gluconacetobacter azotocaptans]
MRSLATYVPACAPETRGAVILELFQNAPDLTLVPVVDDAGGAVGLIEREMFFLRIAGKFGHALFAGRPVSLLMDARPMVVEASVALADFMADTLSIRPSEMQNGFIVTENGKYSGVGSILDLVRAAHAHAQRSADALRQVTEQLQAANDRISRDKLFIDTVVQNIPSAVIVMSAQDRRLAVVNRAAEKILGLARADMLGRELGEIFPAEEGVACLVRGDGASGSEDEQTIQDQDGNERHFVTRQTDIADETGAALWSLCVIEDVTGNRQAQARIERLAHCDALTGLANRSLFGLVLARMCAPGGSGTLLIIDLDYFKAVNDVYGHAMGDHLLRLVAQRLRSVSREGELIARLGGDEFAIIWSSAPAPDELARRANGIVETLSLPYVIDGQHVVIGASIGSACFPVDAARSETLLQYADMALYRAKNRGRNKFQAFTAELYDELQSRVRNERELRNAIATEGLLLHFQPMYRAADNAICGCEALVRWRHPGRGLVAPDEFIGLAEECGAIHELGEWVLRAACREAAAWPGQMKLAVNVSPVQFRDPKLALRVASVLAETGFPAQRLEIEITENVLLNNDSANKKILAALSAMGCSVVLDDFGVGYSSLGYLGSFNFQKIKIDRSFINDSSTKRARGIIQAITGLARSMDIPTTAEGVETAEQLSWLREVGCAEVQGFFLARPGPADMIHALLNAS